MLTLREISKQLKDPRKVEGQLVSDPANHILENFSLQKRRLGVGRRA